jgi:radical SAM/Cys-rich protein
LKRKISFKAQGKTNVLKENQLSLLNNTIYGESKVPVFNDKLRENNCQKLPIKKLKIFQINLGYMCNQVCEHCHVDAGPDRKEIMTWETMKECLAAIEVSRPEIVDLTGGAPEMNPNFRKFILALKKMNVKEIIVRSNLTIFFANNKYSDLPHFFRDNEIHVISSLPCYTKENTDNQRGDGVFNKSIESLVVLNSLGYGEKASLKLDLVFNPGGASLPGDQASLEKDYKNELFKNFGIVFNNLFTITNMPISRFLDYLLVSGNYETYMNALVDSFNSSTLDELMCTNTISVSWDGKLYDCDFNQMLELPIKSTSKHISEFSVSALAKREINTSQHCYGCTSGSGSSCQGAVV